LRGQQETGNGKNNDEMRGFFASLRMTIFFTYTSLEKNMTNLFTYTSLEET